MKLKKGDNIIITSGKDKGKQGKIIKLFSEEGKILVDGVNIVRKRERPRKQGEKGQTVEKSIPFNASNAKYFCESCKKGVRLGWDTEGNKKKVRICRKCGKNAK